MSETILLPIPISWVESISFDRDGARVWIGGGDPEEIDVDPETANRILALLKEVK